MYGPLGPGPGPKARGPWAWAQRALGHWAQAQAQKARGPWAWAQRYDLGQVSRDDEHHHKHNSTKEGDEVSFDGLPCAHMVWHRALKRVVRF